MNRPDPHEPVPSPTGTSPSSLLSRRNLFKLGGLTGAAVVAGVWSPSPSSAVVAGAGSPSSAAAAAAQVDLNFENGSLGAPLTRHAGARLAPAYAHSGSYGCRLDPTTTTSHVADLTIDRTGFELNQPYAVYSMYFRLVTLPHSGDRYMNLFEIGNTSTAKHKSQFTVFFRDDRIVCDFAYRETMDIAPVPVDGGWHLIQAIVDYGATTYTAFVSYDGGAAQTLTSADNKRPQNVRALWIHYPGKAVDYTMDVDDILMSTSPTLPAFFTSPLAQGAARGRTVGGTTLRHEAAGHWGQVA